MKAQNKLARKMAADALQTYHNRFDNDLYRKATESAGVQYANALIDEALAICGDPYQKLSWRNWSKAAIAFLEKFA